MYYWQLSSIFIMFVLLALTKVYQKNITGFVAAFFKKKEKIKGSDMAIAKQSNCLLTAYVLADNSNYAGYDLLQTLTICNLEYDSDLRIFHKYNEKNERWFSLALASEPGTFDLDKLGSASFTGVALFMELATLGANAKLALDDFLVTLEQIQEELGGVIVDARRNPISNSLKDKWNNYADNICRQHGTRDLFDS